MTYYIKVAGKEICDIKVYALSTCIWCKRVKNFFEKNEIAYSYVHVDTLEKELQDEIEDMLGEYTGLISYPVIIAEGHDVIMGYNEKKLNKLLEAHKHE